MEFKPMSVYHARMSHQPPYTMLACRINQKFKLFDWLLFIDVSSTYGFIIRKEEQLSSR